MGSWCAVLFCALCVSLISKIHRVCFKHSNPPALRKHQTFTYMHTQARALFEHLFIVALCQSTTYLARSMSFFPLLTVDLFIFPFLTKFFYFDPLCIFICEKHQQALCQNLPNYKAFLVTKGAHLAQIEKYFIEPNSHQSN